MPTRPNNELELQKREAAGIIRASRFVRKYAHSREPISIAIIREVHKCIFQNGWPDIAGQWRTENLEIEGSKHLPPHFSHVPGLMEAAEKDLVFRLDKLQSTEAFWMDNKDLTEEQEQNLDKVIETAAWLHHKITYIHPFREGNGRTARLAGNLILEGYGLVGISIKVERENKNRYCDALAQADQHNDLEQLKELIYEGLIERYKGVAMRYLK